VFLRNDLLFRLSSIDFSLIRGRFDSNFLRSRLGLTSNDSLLGFFRLGFRSGIFRSFTVFLDVSLRLDFHDSFRFEFINSDLRSILLLNSLDIVDHALSLGGIRSLKNIRLSCRHR
jgi:hypothetical protein